MIESELIEQPLNNLSLLWKILRTIIQTYPNHLVYTCQVVELDLVRFNVTKPHGPPVTLERKTQIAEKKKRKPSP